jgi:uncharacterized coiled-coil protein SlyX
MYDEQAAAALREAQALMNDYYQTQQMLRAQIQEAQAKIQELYFQQVQATIVGGALTSMSGPFKGVVGTILAGAGMKTKQIMDAEIAEQKENVRGMNQQIAALQAQMVATIAEQKKQMKALQQSFEAYSNRNQAPLPVPPLPAPNPPGGGVSPSPQQLTSPSGGGVYPSPQQPSS